MDKSVIFPKLWALIKDLSIIGQKRHFYKMKDFYHQSIKPRSKTNSRIKRTNEIRQKLFIGPNIHISWPLAPKGPIECEMSPIFSMTCLLGLVAHLHVNLGLSYGLHVYWAFVAHLHVYWA